MIRKFKLPAQWPEYDAAINEPTEKHIWIDGDVAHVFNGDDLPRNNVATVTPRQIRLALNRAGLRQAVEQAVAAGSQDLKDWWEYALDIERDNELVIEMATSLGLNSQQLDALFELAASL